MPAVLNTNVASLMASKNLQTAQSKMADSVERLSSGLRINGARDDAAGLGISQLLTSQINSSNQGIRNLNDGISMVQTAEGAIVAASDMAQRILTLATQGANATLSAEARDAIQSEMKQLITGINGISTRANFAGKGLMTEASTTTFGTTNLFTLQLGTSSSDTLSLDASAFKNIGASSTTYTQAIATQANVVANTATGTTNTTVYVKVNGSYVAKNLERVTTTARAPADGSTTAGVATFKLDGVTWSASANYGDIWIASAGTAGVASTLSSSINTAVNTSTTDYQTVISNATTYIKDLNVQRSLLGAYQNQLEFTASNITELSANLSEARSRVADTDYSQETANLTKGQILQQAATAMLAQANQMPNVILSLLK